MKIFAFLFFVCLVVVTVLLILKTKKEDMGCDFDCKNCPFPPCSKEEVERMKKKYEL